MKNELLKYLTTSLVLLLLFVGVFFIGQYRGKKLAIRDFEQRVDTLFICDTITQLYPIVEERIKVEKVLVPVEVRDTIWRRDTMFVELQKEQVIWEDTLARVYASGILPQVDSVQHFIKERVITQEKLIEVKKKSRWGVGVQVGYGAGIKGSTIVGVPYIGVGVSYNILTF